MKEQEHEHVTDQGWAAMQQLLDQQMPRRRRRVAGWWWLTALLLLPLIATNSWYFYQQSKPVTLPIKASSTPAAPLAIQEFPGKNEQHSDLPTNETAPTTSAAPGRVSAALAPHTNEKQGTDHANFTGKKRTTGARVLGTPTSSSRTTQPIVGLFDIDQPAATAVPAVQTLTSEIANQQPLLATLPTPFQLLNWADPAVNVPEYSSVVRREIVKSQSLAQWAFGLTFGANSERLPRINGGLIGLAVDWQPLRHWGLRSGAQYTVQRLASDESLVTAITEDAYERSSNLALFDQSGNYGNITAFSSINTNILASVRRIHRAEIPLAAFYQPLPAFRLYTGGVLNYTFLAQTSNRIFADNQVFKVVSGRDEINRLATERVQRWQVKWQAGLGYRLGNQAELNASIQTTFPKISFRRTPKINSDLDGLNAAGQQRNSPSVQVRQLGVTLSGVVFF